MTCRGYFRNLCGWLSSRMITPVLLYIEIHYKCLSPFLLQLYIIVIVHGMIFYFRIVKEILKSTCYKRYMNLTRFYTTALELCCQLWQLLTMLFKFKPKLNSSAVLAAFQCSITIYG